MPPPHDALFEEVAYNEPLSLERARRIQEELQLIANSGSARQETGPSQGEASSKSSKNSQTKSANSVTNLGKIPNTPILEDLQENFQVQDGVLTVI